MNYVAHLNVMCSISGACQPFWQPATTPDRIERIPVRGVRMLPRKAMAASAFSAPHVDCGC